jgi:hypothetical protein
MRKRTRVLKGLRALLALTVVVVCAYTMGVVSAYRQPQVAVRVFEHAQAVTSPILNLYRTYNASATTSPPAEAMRANIFGVRQNDPSLTGTVLLSLRSNQPGYENRVVEVNRAGEVVWEYREPERFFPGDVRKLPNGNVLILAADCPFGQCPDDAKARVMEVNRASTIVREQALAATHHAELLPNGNLLLVSSPKDRVSEVDRDGNEVWYWDAEDYILRYSPQTYVGYQPPLAVNAEIRNMYAEYREASPSAAYVAVDSPGSEWTHVNSAQRLPNGNTIISLRNLDLVVEVNPKGDVVWTYGALVLKHQHCPWVLDNNHLLVADNGNGRVIEVDRATQQIVWEYADGLRFPVQGCAYRLPSANTLITDSENRRVLEVTPDKQVAWELKVQVPATSGLYRAWWSPE